MQVLLGCGNDYREGWVHLDRAPFAHVDIVHDLNCIPWPFEDLSVERIEAIDVLEHLHNTVAFMDECWRVLQPWGLLYVQAVGWQSENLWRDPTHQRGFHPDTFQYFDPRSPWHQSYGNLYTDRYWNVLLTQEHDGNVIVEMRPIK